jgi:hypothetical protein
MKPAPWKPIVRTFHERSRSWRTFDAGKPPSRTTTSGFAARAKESTRSSGSKKGSAPCAVASPRTTQFIATQSSMTGASTPRPTTQSTRRPRRSISALGVIHSSRGSSTGAGSANGSPMSDSVNAAFKWTGPDRPGAFTALRHNRVARVRQVVAAAKTGTPGVSDRRTMSA